jgi:hypothetical protein
VVYLFKKRERGREARRESILIETWGESCVEKKTDKTSQQLPPKMELMAFGA